MRTKGGHGCLAFDSLGATKRLGICAGLRKKNPAAVGKRETATPDGLVSTAACCAAPRRAPELRQWQMCHRAGGGREIVVGQSPRSVPNPLGLGEP
eukprot:scaffold34299_cov112-Isochrysis_galbana.AAC.1